MLEKLKGKLDDGELKELSAFIETQKKEAAEAAENNAEFIAKVKDEGRKAMDSEWRRKLKSEFALDDDAIKADIRSVLDAAKIKISESKAATNDNDEITKLKQTIIGLQQEYDKFKNEEVIKMLEEKDNEVKTFKSNTYLNAAVKRIQNTIGSDAVKFNTVKDYISKNKLQIILNENDDFDILTAENTKPTVDGKVVDKLAVIELALKTNDLIQKSNPNPANPHIEVDTSKLSERAKAQLNGQATT